jgi:hypothetical protein
LAIHLTDTVREWFARSISPTGRGRWIALDESDRVARDAETRQELMAILDTEGVEGVSIMCATVPGEPVRYGLG